MREKKKTTSHPNPELISEIAWASTQSKILTAACKLDLFTKLHSLAEASAAKLADEVGANERGVRILCDALAAMKLLNRKKDRYTLSPVSSGFLVRGKPGDSTEMVLMHDQLVSRQWRDLVEVVKAGHPTSAVNDEEVGVEFFSRLVHILYPRSLAASQAAVRFLGVGKRRKGLNVLDVAAGSGAWGLAFATADPSTRVTALDWEAVLSITREYVSRHKVEPQYRFLAGNVRELDLGKEVYDLIILGHICHSEGLENTQLLLRRSTAALKRGGRLLIAEFLRNDQYTGPLVPALFGVNMLVHTSSGDVWSFADFKKWLSDLGFKAVRKIPAPAPSPLILAEK